VFSSVAHAAKKVIEPVVVPLANVGDGHAVAAFGSLQEYRDWISVIVMIIVFCFREAYQYKKDRERLGAIEEQQKKIRSDVLIIERSQLEMSASIAAFIKAQEKAEDRLERRVSRLEGDKR
jgi:hypothetical protein